MLLDLSLLMGQPVTEEAPIAEGEEAVQSETDLLNTALGLIGAQRINNITDNSPNANWCKTMYPNLRRSLLRYHYWNFAEDRAQLSLSADPPLFEFTSRYALPANFIRLTTYNGAQLPNPITVLISTPYFWPGTCYPWKIEGRFLLSNDSQAFITYIRDEPNPALWDPLFFETVYTKLAGMLAMAIGKDSTKSVNLLQTASNMILSIATAADGQESAPSTYPVPDLIIGR